MAPTAIDPYPTSQAISKTLQSDLADGIQTSGQHPPLYDQLKPYEGFPTSIDEPTLWRSEDYKDNPERWTHRFTSDEIRELSEAADRFRESGTHLTNISQVRPRDPGRWEAD